MIMLIFLSTYLKKKIKKKKTETHLTSTEINTILHIGSIKREHKDREMGRLGGADSSSCMVFTHTKKLS